MTNAIFKDKLTKNGVPAKAMELNKRELDQVAGGYTLFSIGDTKFSVTDTVKLFGGSLIPGLPAGVRIIEGYHLNGEDTWTCNKEALKEFGEQALEYTVAATGMMGKGVTQVIACGAAKAAKTAWGWFKSLW